jgi:membrane associated rhomboid family serine protease
MKNIQQIPPEKRKFFYAIFIPAIIGILMTFSLILEKGMNLDFQIAGVYPRRIENIWGIFTLIFIHSGWSHLANNVISFVVLGSLLFYFYSEIAPKVLLISYVFSGLILWIIGRESWHVGASGLIYALAFFLFFSGIIRKHIPLISISLIVAFIYGNMVWHLFPWQTQDPISWEGHLSGGIVGFFLSILYRNKEPQKPVKNWDEDNEDDYISDDYIENFEDETNSKI